MTVVRLRSNNVTPIHALLLTTTQDGLMEVENLVQTGLTTEQEIVWAILSMMLIVIAVLVA